MAVVCSTSSGWVISHEKYVEQVYDTVVEFSAVKKLKLLNVLFEIHTPYLRDGQAEKLSSHRESNKLSVSRGRKRNRKTQQDHIPQIVNIQERLVDLVEEGKRCGHFLCVPSLVKAEENNRAARVTAERVYAASSCPSAPPFHGYNNGEARVITCSNNETYLFPANSTFFSYDVKDLASKLNEEFDLILLDPPWWNKYIRRKKSKCSEAGYEMMYSEDLLKIPVASVMKLDGIVAVWCTNCPAHLEKLRNEIFPAWNVKYLGKWFWIKVTSAGEPVCPFSVPPGKQPFEQIVLGCSKLRNDNLPLPEDMKVIISIPSAVHSHKPPLIELLKVYIPEDPKCLELFARYLLPGWTSWGHEVLKLQHVSLYEEANKLV